MLAKLGIIPGTACPSGRFGLRAGRRGDQAYLAESWSQKAALSVLAVWDSDRQGETMGS